MKNRKPMLLLLVFAMLLSMLASCGSSGTSDETTPAETEPTDLVFAAADAGKCFSIVRAEKLSDSAVRSAVDLRKSLEDAGAAPEIHDDYLMPGQTPAEGEILIGLTNREESEMYPEDLAYNDFFVGVIQGKIVLLGGSDSATASAVYYFIENFVEGKTELKVPKDLSFVYHSEIHTYDISEILDKLKIYGRHSMVGNNLACDLTASGIEFIADCEGSVEMEVYASGGDVYYSAFVDGVRCDCERGYIPGGKTATVTVADGIVKGLHIIRIVKDTESRQPALISKLSFAGELYDKPEDSEIFLEFIGDSITCGYGINGAKDSSDLRHFAGSKSFAYQTADLLEADYSMVCISGYSMGTKGSMQTNLWPYTSFKRSPKPKYDFARKPSAVIINLGTNDASGGSYSNSTSDFEAGMKKLISQIRKDYNDTSLPIVFVYDMMSSGYQSNILKVIGELGGEGACLYSYKGVRNNNGINNHPNLTAHTKTAQGLAEFLKNTVLK